MVVSVGMCGGRNLYSQSGVWSVHTFEFVSVLNVIMSLRVSIL